MYKQERLTFTDSNGVEKTVLFYAGYENGVRVRVSDMQGVFACDFAEYLGRVHEENEREYFGTAEVVPVPVLIDAVYSLPDPDRGTLFSWLDAIERRLVRVW